MLKGFTRLLAFFTKELNEVRRQPRLVLALILGPFLILLLFGLGYQTTPRPRAILVIPEAVEKQVDMNAVMYAANLTYQVVGTTTNESEAMAKLSAREVDVVQSLPPDVRERIERGEPVPVSFYYAEINPLNETYLQSIGYAQVNEMNKALLLQTAIQVQEEARANREWVGGVRGELDALSADSSNPTQQQNSIRRLRSLVGVMVASPILAAQLTADGQDPARVKTELTALAADLDALDQSITAQTFARQAARLDAVRSRVAQFETLLKNFSEMSPQVIVAPLYPSYENAQGEALTLSNFYAPAVLALILQHIAVTLGALSLVRERLLGAIELFRVAPVSTRQILLGKYLAYLIFIGIIGGVLALAMSWMQVPFRGDPGMFVAILALLVIAGLGIGFLISTVSKSDTQAVQLSMLVLLFSIFFSGFFLPLENFLLPIRAMGYAMPITPGILALQDVMLRGAMPSLFVWLLLGGTALVTFVLVNLFASRQLKFAQ